MIQPQTARQICEALQSNKLSINWSFMAMPQKGFTPDLLETLKENGCRWITWGIESASPKTLKRMNKPIHLSQCRQILIHAHLNGIANVLLFIQGYPYETQEEWNQTHQFILEMQPYFYDHTQSPFHLTVHSPMYDDPEQFGLTHLKPLPIFETKEWSIPSHLYSYELTRPWNRPDYYPVQKVRKHTIPLAEHMLIVAPFAGV